MTVTLIDLAAKVAPLSIPAREEFTTEVKVDHGHLIVSNWMCASPLSLGLAVSDVMSMSVAIRILTVLLNDIGPRAGNVVFFLISAQFRTMHFTAEE